MKKFIALIVIIVLVGGLGFWGPLNRGHFNHHSVMDEYTHHSNEHSSELQKSDMDTTEFIKIHSTSPEVKDFFTQFRTDEILSFPCQNCHNVPLDEMTFSEATRAHWDINLKHASQQLMTCTTCHQKDNMNMLTSLTGTSISLDQSFELCGQCHSSQFKDWQGGAHGKNLSNWNSPRIVKTCVSCHNPHDPQIKSRWPSRLNNTNKLPRQTK